MMPAFLLCAIAALTLSIASVRPAPAQIPEQKRSQPVLKKVTPKKTADSVAVRILPVPAPAIYLKEDETRNRLMIVEATRMGDSARALPPPPPPPVTITDLAINRMMFPNSIVQSVRCGKTVTIDAASLVAGPDSVYQVQFYYDLLRAEPVGTRLTPLKVSLRITPPEVRTDSSIITFTSSTYQLRCTARLRLNTPVQATIQIDDDNAVKEEQEDNNTCGITLVVRRVIGD